MAKPRRKVAKVSKSPVDEDKKRQRRVLIVGIVMIALMILSISSVAFYNPSYGSGDQYKYGDIEFRFESLPNGGGVLLAELNGQEVEFQNLPTQVGYLDVDPAAVDVMRGARQLGLVADPRMDSLNAGYVDYARLQLSLAIPQAFNAMSVEDDRYTLPVLNCTHASKEMPLIMFNMTNETTSITTDGYCISLQATGRELMQLKDRLIFEYHGILADGEVVE